MTSVDILKSIVGPLATPRSPAEADMVQREDGSWLISGSLPVDELAERLAIDLPQPQFYHTAAGFVLDRLEHLPQVGKSFDAFGWRFEVVDLDGRRIDKILVAAGSPDVPVGRAQRILRPSSPIPTHLVTRCPRLLDW